LGEVTVYAGLEVLVEVGDASVVIIGDQRGILGQQLRPHPFHLLLLLLFYKTSYFE
jgi:hypothetical protein